MKTVAAHATLGKCMRKCERLRHRWLAVMERRVEARDLRQLRRAGKERLDRRQVVRLVQRRERNVFFEPRNHRGVETDRLDEFQSAVHDAVPDRDKRVVG